MPNPFSRLLLKKRFWEVLVVINLTGVVAGGQPVVLVSSIMLVFGLWVLSCIWWSIQKFMASNYFAVFMKCVGIAFLWLMLAGAIGYQGEKAKWFEMRDHTSLLLICSALIIVIPYCTFRYCKWIRLQKRLHASKVQSGRDSEQRVAAQKERDHAQKRRDDARTKCELYYRCHAPEIASRFSEKHFADYVQRHMHDRLTPEYVEERAGQLLTLLETHRERIGPTKVSLGELAEWYVTQKREIQNSPLDEEEKVIAVTQLEERFVRMQDRAIRKMRPV